MRSPLKLMDWSNQLIVWILVAMKSVSPPMLAEGGSPDQSKGIAVRTTLVEA